MVDGWQEEVCSGGRDITAAAAEMASCHDELSGEPVAPQVAGALGMVHADGEVFVDLEMQVWGVHSVIIPDGADLLAPGDLLALAYADPIQMCVEGVSEVQAAVLDPGMADNDHVPPSHVNIPGQHDNPVPDCIDGLTESLGAASVSDPVLSEMSSCPKTTRFVVTGGCGRRHGQIKAVGRPRGVLG